MAFKLAEAFVRLFVKRDEFREGLEGAKADTQNFVGAVNGLARKAAGLVAGVLTAKAIIDVGRAALDSADRLAKLSQITGMSVEDLSRLGYAAAQSGSDGEALATAMRYLARNTDEAAAGGESARNAFRAVGVTMDDLRSKSPQEILLQIANAFASGSVKGSKAAVAMQLFGRAGAELVPLLNGGQKGIKALTDEADRLGITVSTQFAADAEVFNDRVAAMRMRLGGVARTIVSSLLPSLETMVRYIGDDFKSTADEAAQSTDRWSKVTRFLASTFIMASHGALVLAANAQATWRVLKAPFSDDTVKDAFIDWRDRLDELDRETNDALTNLFAPDKNGSKAAEDLATDIGLIDEKAAKLALQVRAANLQLELQVAQMQGNIERTRELSAALDKVAAAQMKMEGASPESIAEFLRLSAQVRELGFEESSRRVYEIEADMGRQLVQLTVDRETAAREIEKQSHRERVMEYEQMLATAEEKNALIEQSHALMMANLHEIDINYGRDWAGLWQRMLVEYDSTGAQMVGVAERVAADANTMFSDVLFAGIEGDLESIQDALKNFSRAVIREFTNILASKATAQLLKLLPQIFGMGGTSWASFAPGGAYSSGFTFANGGIAPGGFKAFASGGIVTSPTLGLVGEGHYNEAVIPLPDGKHVEAVVKDGGQQPIVVEVSWSPDFIRGVVNQAAQQGATMATSQVIPIVAEDYMKNGTLRRVFRFES
jgi:hypothetical protein